ncbi:hypothetical protein FHX12_002399 [Rhizobium sp. BK609]|nr:hypothetical protein [Rhizobium sp. BK098]MBB3615418.1 hypothetical protein [Rhizobium sp. BK609]MBB3681078.1 hypothetical protein [Rhizobium sp. BK612]
MNNSGVYEFGPRETVTEAQFHKMFDISVLCLLLGHAGGCGLAFPWR